ncbi:hypothetical protein DFJ43DRAFT_817174 [Lentinula guzmanii]|uniref:Anti-proliferative protein domain-containing protein n=1 Tax=Lentinula guzmanii TaxID=2804957 RepID=A0AA38JSL2_9AGAR|nr:hypothetical protein DFJ43DRAFT_817174 [Lentinula guzmanii]
MSFSTGNSASTTLYQLVTYLTRPLIEIYPAQTILQLQFFLHANLASQFLSPETFSLSPFTLLLTPGCLPPTPVYAACLQAGIAWPQWIRALGGKALYVFVMDGNLKVRTGEVDDAVTFWFADPSESSAHPTSKIQTQISSDEDQSPMTLKLQATLDSVRSRSSTAAKPRMSALLTSSCLFNSTRNAVNDSDSESDTESTASSSLFSETSSIESMSSLSSTASSPVSKSSNLSLPLEIPASSKVPVYIPRGRRAAPSLAPAQTIDTTSHHHLSRSQRRLARSTVDKGKVDTCRYTYQGGQTLVMTGGVMLGGVKSAGAVNSPKVTKPRSSTIRTPQSVSTINSQTIRKGPDSSKNWRARV